MGLALVSLLGFGAVNAGSCASVLGLGDQQSAGVALCDKLHACYEKGAFPDCEERIGGAVSAAAPATVEQWLRDFTTAACVASCDSARACLDNALFCGATTCAEDADCCAASRGYTGCSSQGQCCAKKGAPCTGLACCEGAGACQSGYCGGIACREPGAECKTSKQCCSHVCQPNGTCSAKLCGGEGFECANNQECCEDEGLICDASRRCNKPTCTLAGQLCRSASECCDGFCVDLGAGVGVCSTCEKRLPDGVDCFQGDDCCGDACDPVLHVCAPICVPNLAPCTSNQQCCSGACTPQGKCADTCTDGYCNVDGDCCSGKCLPGGTCDPSCPKDARCDHDVCSVGGTLNGACPAGSGVDAACADAVAQIDKYCACVAWDTLCAQRALGVGGLPQPMQCAGTKCSQGVVP